MLIRFAVDSKSLRGSHSLHKEVIDHFDFALRHLNLKEDANQTSHLDATKNLGALRRIALSLLDHNKWTIKSMPRKRFQAFMNIPYRERLLSLA